MKTKRVLFALVVVLAALIIPFTQALTQDNNVTLEITGVNPTDLPQVLISANVTNALGQPVVGLGIADFTLSGELAAFGTIVDVQNIRDDNLPFAVVLVIDTSSSVADFIGQMREAAIGFVNAVGEDVSIALVAFNSEVRLIRDYTTDRATLINDIETLPFGGQTALYQAGFDAVELANRAPYPRRAVVMLSDGGEFGGFSTVARSAGVDEAIARGVSVYTIGLGYDFDRTYLQELAGSTNGSFYESPTADQLAGIYDDIATVLRSQYVITLQVDVPADGTEYPFTLTANTPNGSVSADGVMRAPIPVPIIRLPDAPAGPLTETTTFTIDVLADDQPVSVTINGETQDELPYTLDVDPQSTASGDYTLDITATDADGESSSASFTYTVAALPSEVRVSLPEGELAEPASATIEIFGQTPTSEVLYAIDGGEPLPAEQVDAAYAALITPFELAPGEHILSVTVSNEGGVTTTVDTPFTVAALPPVITVTGIEPGQTVDAPVTVQVSAVGQTPLDALAIGVTPSDPDEAIQTSVPNEAGTTTFDYTLEIDPYAFPPGAASLAFAISDTSGSSTSGSVDFSIAELPIELLLDGLTESETISADREITIDFRSQTPVVHVAVFVDSEDLAHLIQAPFQTTIRVLDYAPGPHLLRIIADTADGRTANFDVGFIIDTTPSVNATGTAVSIQSTTDAVSVQATNDAQATNAAVSAGATGTAVAELATVDAANAQATNDAQSTATAIEATSAAQATSDAVATVTASAEQAAQQGTATANAERQQATIDAASTMDAVNAQSTQTAADVRATRGAVATTAAEAATSAAQTGVPQQTAVAANAQATRDSVNAQATVNAVDAQATSSVRATIDAANAQATNDAQSAADTQATNDAQATLDTQATTDAQALGGTSAAETATAGAEGTSVAQASVVDATATADAELALAQTSTADAVAANAQGTATADAAATATEQAASVQQTATALAIGVETSTAEAALTQTAAAQPTATATATPTATEEATAEPTAEAQVEDLTPTEQPTLIPEVGENAPDASADLTIPLIIGCVVLLIILLVVWLLLAGRRRNRPETRR